MTDSILNQLGFDPVFIIIGMAVIIIILLIVVIVGIFKMKKLYRAYDVFMRGKDAETLEDNILDQIEEIRKLKAEDKANKDAIRKVNKMLSKTYQKSGIVKYDAFKGMGGKLSFCLTLLNRDNTGFIINSVHAREGCYTYLKEVESGKTTIVLSEEEKESLEKALSI